MSMVKGWSTVKSVYRESAWGVTATPLNAFGANVQTIDSSANRNMIEDPTMTADRNMSRSLFGNVDVTHNIVTTLNPEQSPFWLSMLLGIPTTTGSTAPYTHTYDPRVLPSFTLETDMSADIASTVLRYVGCRVASGSIQINQEGPAVLTLNTVAKSLSIESAPLDATPTYPTHVPWGAEHSKVTLDGVQQCDIASATINFDNMLDTGVYTLPCSGGTYGQRGELPSGQCKISGQMDLLMDSTAKGYLEKAIAMSTHAIQIVFQFGTGDGSAAGKEKIIFNMPQVDFGLFAPAINTRSGIRVTVPFTCHQATQKSLYVTVLSPRTAATLYLA